MMLILSENDFLLPDKFTIEQAQKYMDQYVAYQEYSPEDVGVIYALVGGEANYIEIKKRIELTHQRIKEKFAKVEVQSKLKKTLEKSKNLKPEKKEILDEVKKVGIRI